MLDLVRIYLAVFGAVTIFGGVMGFVKAKSHPSLIAGGISGALLLVAAYLAGSTPRAALVLGLVVSLALFARFAPKLRAPKATVARAMTGFALVGAILTAAALAPH